MLPHRTPASTADADLLASSSGRRWGGISAELRRYCSGTYPIGRTARGIELCIGIAGSQTLITRRWEGRSDQAVAARGAIWIAPPQPEKGSIAISGPVPELLHIHLPQSHFSAESLGVELAPSVRPSLNYECSVQDPLLAEIGFAIAAELHAETSGGSMLAETMAALLAARLVQNHRRAAVHAPAATGTAGLDRLRLSRVLQHIDENVEGDLSIKRLASIACLSHFHFARAFKAAVGQSPHRYVSAKRLDRAQALLLQGDDSLVDIALALNFSCQANFTRAFRQATGRTPGEYRRSSGAGTAVTRARRR